MSFVLDMCFLSQSLQLKVFDFAHLLPGLPQARVNARVVMSPLGAKLLYRALGENLARYEAAFGEIKTPTESTLADFLFRPPAKDKEKDKEE